MIYFKNSSGKEIVHRKASNRSRGATGKYGRKPGGDEAEGKLIKNQEGNVK